MDEIYIRDGESLRIEIGVFQLPPPSLREQVPSRQGYNRDKELSRRKSEGGLENL